VTGHDVLAAERWSADPVAVAGPGGYISTRTEFAEHGPDAHRVTTAWAHENSGGVRHNGRRQTWLRARADWAQELAILQIEAGDALTTGRATNNGQFDAAAEYWRLAYQRCGA
jgi:hypothetical protein